MLRENDYIFSRLNMGLDLLMGACGVLAAHVLRNYVLAPYFIPDIFRYRSYLRDYWWLLIFLPVLTVMLLQYNGFYRSQRVRSVGTALGAIFFATLGASLTAIVISFIFTPRGQSGAGWMGIFSQEFVSRGVLLLFTPIATVLLALKSLAIRRFLLNLRNRGYNTRNLLLVGRPDLARDFLGYVNKHPFWGFQVCGLLTHETAVDQPVPGLPIVGDYKDLFGYLENNVIDDVVFVGGDEGLQALAPMLRGCEEMGIRARIPMHPVRSGISRPFVENFNNLPVITFDPVRAFGWSLLFKYAFDRVVAALLLILLSPFFLIIALMIKLTSDASGASVFFGQTRSGLNGRQFTLWKFRSMIVDAETCRLELEQMNEMSGPVFKMKNDPRVTKIGRWLRKTSMDELPQLWNVLRGDMSLVGPRPPLPQEVAHYDRWQRRRLSMKPGITCIWQVSGRNTLSFEKWMQLDLQYIDNWSLKLDMKILFKTIYVVATGHGAM